MNVSLSDCVVVLCEDGKPRLHHLPTEARCYVTRFRKLVGDDFTKANFLNWRRLNPILRETYAPGQPEIFDGNFNAWKYRTAPVTIPDPSKPDRRVVMRIVGCDKMIAVNAREIHSVTPVKGRKNVSNRKPQYDVRFCNGRVELCHHQQGWREDFHPYTLHERPKTAKHDIILTPDGERKFATHVRRYANGVREYVTADDRAGAVRYGDDGWWSAQNGSWRTPAEYFATNRKGANA